MRELRDAVRQWARTPVITIVVVASLALGIGANTAIFSLIDSLLLRPLPVAHPDELVRVHEEGYNFQSIPVWNFIHTRTSVLASSASVSLMRPDISSSAERRSALGLAVSGSFFDVLGVKPALGRLITEDDDRAGAQSDVVVLEYEFWRRAFNGGNVLGQTIPLDGRPFTIIGVVERGFFGLNVGRRFDLAIPIEGFKLISPGVDDPLSNSFTVFGRLGPDQSIGAATAALQGIQDTLRASLQFPDNYPRLRKPLTLVPMSMGLATTTQDRYARPLWVLLAIAGIVLLTACANVANVQLARGAARRPELATRLALGASRRQVIFPLFIESLLIGLTGAAFGVLVGTWSARGIVNAIAVDQANALATWIDVSLNLRMLAFTAAAGVATAIVFGVGPALWTSRVDSVDAMRPRSRGHVSGHSRVAASQLLVVAQVALAFVLVLSGALLTRSFINLTKQDLGFGRGALLVAVPDYNRSSVSRRNRVPVSDRIRAELSSAPGIMAAGFAESTPFGFGLRPWPVIIAGKTAAEGDMTPLNRIGSGYLSTVGMTLMAGRDFAPTGLESPNSALVNETFARRYFGDASPIGQSFSVKMNGRSQVQIVGVVRDIRDMSVRDPAAPTVYMPLLAADEPWIEISVRPTVDEPEARRLVLDVLARQAPGARVEFRTVGEGVRNASSRDRVIAWLSGGFAGLALLLSAIGLYGVMSHQVIRRRQEFGVRVAIGAAPSSVTALVLKQAVWMIGLGIAAGVAGAVAASRVIAALLFDVRPGDPVSIAIAAGVLATVTVLAGLVPARRAARVDPMTALREE